MAYQRYRFEYRLSGCLIFDNTIGSTTKGFLTEDGPDPDKAIATCRDPEIAQRIVDMLNKERPRA